MVRQQGVENDDTAQICLWVRARCILRGLRLQPRQRKEA